MNTVDSTEVTDLCEAAVNLNNERTRLNKDPAAFDREHYAGEWGCSSAFLDIDGDMEQRIESICWKLADAMGCDWQTASDRLAQEFTNAELSK